MKRRVWQKLGLIGLVTGLAVALSGVSAPTSASVTELEPAADAFVDVNNPSTNFDGAGLDLGYSNFPTFASVREAYLRFDLSGVGQLADRSLLNVTITSNSWEVGSTLAVALYAVSDDSWDETTLTFSNAPSGTTLTHLQTIQVPAGTTGNLVFGDDNAVHPVGTFVETERLADGNATFLIRLTAGTNVTFAGNSTLEDSEDSQTPAIMDGPILDIGGPTATYSVFVPIIHRE